MNKYDNVTVKEYMEKKLKMLNDLGTTNGFCDYDCCEDCPLSSFNNGTRYNCNALELLYPEKAIEIIMNYEPKVDWSKVPVDTKVLVKDLNEEDWKKRHFSKYEGGKIYTYPNGTSSFTNDGETISWNYCKLYKEE